MRSSLLKQLVIHCSLLLVKSTEPKVQNETVALFNRILSSKIPLYFRHIWCISSQPFLHCKTQHHLKTFNGAEVISELDRALKEKDRTTLKNTIETMHQDLPLMARDVESNFVKLLRTKFSNLKVLTDGKSAKYKISTDKANINEFLCLHMLSKYQDKLLLFLCNSILDEFESAGASEEVLNSIKEKLYGFIISMSCAIHELRNSAKNKGHDRLKIQLNDLFKSSLSSIFMIESYYQAFLYVEINKLEGESDFSDQITKRYADLYIYINALYTISDMIHHAPFYIRKDSDFRSEIRKNSLFCNFIGQFNNISDDSFNKLNSIISTANITEGFVNTMNKHFIGYMLPKDGTKYYSDSTRYDFMVPELYKYLFLATYENTPRL